MSQAEETIYLVYTDIRANSNKFWKATVYANDSKLETHWGRVGYLGQSKSYNCNSYNHALAKLRLLAAEKIRKGYRETQTEARSLERQQIIRALLLLESIRKYVEHRNFNNSNYLQSLNEYLSIIPTPVGMLLNVETIYRSTADVDKQIQILRHLLTATSTNDPEQHLDSSSSQQLKQLTSLKSISELFWKF